MYSQLLDFSGAPKNEKYTTKRIIQEIHMDNETVVSKLDFDMDYLHIDKFGRVGEFKLTKTKFEKSSKKIFERHDESLTEIMVFEIPKNDFLNDNGIRLTFITEKGNHAIFGSFADLEKRKITGQTVVHFFNLVELTDPKGLEKILKNSR